MTNRLPVTVVSGFLGAGKTAVVSGLLNSGQRRLAVVANDLGSVNVDAHQLQAQHGSQDQPWLGEVTGGCACCTLRDELATEITRLTHAGSFDGLVIEAAGTAYPRAVAEALIQGTLAATLRLDTLVTVVDAGTFLNQCPWPTAAGEGEPPGDATPRPAQTELLAEQVANATALVVNKTDLVTPTELDALEAMLAHLNPNATITRAQHGRLAPERLLNTGGFAALHTASNAPALASAAAGARGTRFQIGSFVYTSRRPFHPERLWRLLQRKPWFGALRSKGFVWLASRPSVAALWSQVGAWFQLESAGLWWGTEHPEPPANGPCGAPVFGECRQEIAFFGHQLDGAVLSAALDECLLTDRELSGGPMAWCFLPDPLPASFRVAELVR